MFDIRNYTGSVWNTLSGWISDRAVHSILDKEANLHSNNDPNVRIINILELIELYRKAQLFPDIINISTDILRATAPLTRIQKSKLVEVVALAFHKEGRTPQAVEMLKSEIASCLSDGRRQRLMARYLAGSQPDRSLEIYRDLPVAALSPSDLRVYCHLLMGAGGVNDVGHVIDTFIGRRGRLRPVSAPLAAELSLLRYEVAFRRGNSSQLRKEIARLFERLGIEAAPADLTPRTLQAVSASRHDRPVASRDKVSIIMTTFNSAEWLEMSITSLLRQTHSNIEVIVVDDCSSDCVTWDLIRGWPERDKRVVVLKTSANSGTYVAKNQGLDIATGDLVTFHDSDDWAHPYRIESQARAFGSGKLIANQSQWFKISADGCPILKPWGSYIYSNPASVMVRKKVFDELGKFDTVRIGADTEFIARVRCYYGDSSYSMIAQPLTVGLERQNALTGSGIGRMDASGFNAVRSAYSYAWRRWHLDIAAGVCRNVKIDRRHSDPFALPAALRI